MCWIPISRSQRFSVWCSSWSRSLSRYRLHACTTLKQSSDSANYPETARWDASNSDLHPEFAAGAVDLNAVVKGLRSAVCRLKLESCLELLHQPESTNRSSSNWRIEANMIFFTASDSQDDTTYRRVLNHNHAGRITLYLTIMHTSRSALCSGSPIPECFYVMYTELRSSCL
jgi:hypothetical protein